MKKYTNKILVAALVLFFAAFAIRFFIIASEVKKEIKQSGTNELIINY
jgi:hypothetical protein